jgi:2-oxoglutarate ferredoxin oxidoreductase subunit delta
MPQGTAAGAAVRDEEVNAPVIIRVALCKACGICIGLCPKDVLEVGPDGVATVGRSDDCTACRVCELHCPDFAISVMAPARRRSTRAIAERDR